MEQKKWYQSKIVLFCISAVLVVGGNLLTGFLTGEGVTPDQLSAIKSAQPEIANAVEKLQAGESALQVIAGLFPVIILILRVWFTSAPIATGKTPKLPHNMNATL